MLQVLGGLIPGWATSTFRLVPEWKIGLERIEKGGEISLRWVQFDLLAISGEASPTFGHENANFSMFIDRIRNQFLKK